MAIIYTINQLCSYCNYWALNRIIELVLQKRDSLLLHNFSKVGSWIIVSLNVTVDFMFCAVCSTPIAKCTIMECSLFAVTKHVESASWSCACACDGGGGGRVPPVACSARTAARQSTTPPPTVHTSCLLSVREFILVSVPCSCWFDFICRLIFYQCCVFWFHVLYSCLIWFSFLVRCIANYYMI